MSINTLLTNTLALFSVPPLPPSTLPSFPPPLSPSRRSPTPCGPPTLTSSLFTRPTACSPNYPQSPFPLPTGTPPTLPPRPRKGTDTPTLSTPPPRVWGASRDQPPNQLQNLPSIWNSDTGRMVAPRWGTLPTVTFTLPQPSPVALYPGVVTLPRDRTLTLGYALYPHPRHNTLHKRPNLHLPTSTLLRPNLHLPTSTLLHSNPLPIPLKLSPTLQLQPPPLPPYPSTDQRLWGTLLRGCPVGTRPRDRWILTPPAVPLPWV